MALPTPPGPITNSNDCNRSPAPFRAAPDYASRGGRHAKGPSAIADNPVLRPGGIPRVAQAEPPRAEAAGARPREQAGDRQKPHALVGPSPVPSARLDRI